MFRINMICSTPHTKWGYFYAVLLCKLNKLVFSLRNKIVYITKYRLLTKEFIKNSWFSLINDIQYNHKPNLTKKEYKKYN